MIISKDALSYIQNINFECSSLIFCNALFLTFFSIIVKGKKRGFISHPKFEGLLLAGQVQGSHGSWCNDVGVVKESVGGGGGLGILSESDIFGGFFFFFFLEKASEMSFFLQRQFHHRTEKANTHSIFIKSSFTSLEILHPNKQSQLAAMQTLFTFSSILF